MIHIIIGTKAQFIKMVPVIKGLESRNVSYNLINLGQHAATVYKLAEQFGVKNSKIEIQGEDVVSIVGMLKWLFAYLTAVVFRPGYIKENVFKGQVGLALIHGDTLSTLVGFLLAKRAGLEVAHIESGLRSWNYFHPFPEEVIRIVSMMCSDYLFAPSDEAVDNLKKMKVKGGIYNTGGNTGMDAVKIMLDTEEKESIVPKEPYVLVSIHRFENLYSKKRFKFILDTVDEISQRFKVIFVMHGPTEKRLKKIKVVVTDSESSIAFLPLQSYPGFLKLIRSAEFVVTDGGTVQEESFYLGKPCLIMRKRTERPDGVGESAVLAKFDRVESEQFVNHYKSFEREAASLQLRPSDVVIDEILRL